MSVQPSHHAPGSVENGVWYLDYTSYDHTNIPDGVNTINIFCAGLKQDASGNISIDGGPNNFLEGFRTQADFQKFISDCKAKGIDVKLSIGGQGGSFDKCWDVLNTSSPSKVASALVDFCKNNGLDGIDFDYEENQEGGGEAQEVLVGKLIKSFKDQGPDFSASLCTCAGDFWQQAAKTILDQTLSSDGKTSVIDHLYIMSYSGTTQDVENQADHWAQFLANYNLPPSAATIGINSTEQPGYDADAIAKYAKAKGYSTMIWNYNPTDPTGSDSFAKRIHDDYYGK